jgi:hypothetical protein
MRSGNIVLILIACSSFLPMFSAQAQHRVVHQLRSTDGPISTIKLIHSVVHDIDPGAQCSFHGDQVKVMIDNSVTAVHLVDRLSVSGVGLFVVMLDGGKEERLPMDGLPKNFPTRMSTGNDALDDANYLHLKEAWIEVHPQAYEQLNQLDEQPALRKPQSMEE